MLLNYSSGGGFTKKEKLPDEKEDNNDEGKDDNLDNLDFSVPKVRNSFVLILNFSKIQK